GRAHRHVFLMATPVRWRAVCSVISENGKRDRAASKSPWNQPGTDHRRARKGDESRRGPATSHKDCGSRVAGMPKRLRRRLFGGVVNLLTRLIISQVKVSPLGIACRL